MLQPNPDALLG